MRASAIPNEEIPEGGKTIVIAGPDGVIAGPGGDLLEVLVTEDRPGQMHSRWVLEPGELEDIKNGSPIYLIVWGYGHPPVAMYTLQTN